MIKQITEEEFKDCLNLTRLYSPLALPAGWQFQETTSGPLAGQFRYANKGLLVIFTADRLWGDNKIWLHVSMSRQNRLPSYEDMTMVKDIFIGKLRQALQIFPREDRHVNIHPFCLHLWSCIGGDGLPDFGRHGTI